MLTPEEVAASLRVSAETIRRWCRTGEIPAIRIGRLWRIKQTTLDALLEGRLDATG